MRFMELSVAIGSSLRRPNLRGRGLRNSGQGSTIQGCRSSASPASWSSTLLGGQSSVRAGDAQRRERREEAARRDIFSFFRRPPQVPLRCWCESRSNMLFHLGISERRPLSIRSGRSLPYPSRPCHWVQQVETHGAARLLNEQTYYICYMPGPSNRWFLDTPIQRSI